MWCGGLVVLCAVRVVSPDVGQLSSTTGVPVFPRSLEEATLPKPEDDPVTEAMSAEVGMPGTTTLSSVSSTSSAPLSIELLPDRGAPAESTSATLHRNTEEIVSLVVEDFGIKNLERATSTASTSLSAESSSRAEHAIFSTVPAPQGVASGDRYQKSLESPSPTTSPPVSTRDHKTLNFNSSTSPSSGGQRTSSGDESLAEPFSATRSKDSTTQMDLIGKEAALVGGPILEAQGLVSSSPPPGEGRENDSEDADDYYDEDEEYEDDEDEADDDEEGDEDGDQDDDEDDAEDDAEVQEDPERRAEVRSLSDLPLSKLLQVRGELRRLAGLTGLGQDECASGDGVDSAQRRSSSSGSMSRTNPQAMALNWSGTRSSAKGDDAGSKGVPLRRGVWGWDEEEEEDEHGWMSGWKSKKKKGKGDIGSVFQIAVTFLAFLAFGGYLLCLCITAIKGGGGYYYPAYGQLRPAPSVMMVMVAPNRLAPNRRPRPPATGKKRRRRSDPSGAESGEQPPGPGAWWSWAPWEDEPWEGPWATPDLGSLRADHMHRALLLLAEGYATYYHRKYNP